MTDTTIASITDSGFVKPRTESGFDTIRYIVNNSCGIDTAFFPVRFARCGGVNKVNSQSNVSIHPNPATTSINITSDDKIESICITDLVGQSVYSNICQKREVQVNITDLPAGVYFVKINGTEVGKFVKQ